MNIESSQATQSSLDRQTCPIDVGIIAIEPYFPRDYVDHSKLQMHMKIPKGKFTAGIGQKSMSIPSDLQDSVSMAITATKNLIDSNKIDPSQVGRIEIGTQSLVDKSKTSKCYLIEHIFRDRANFDIEGCTSLMACYGGTNALFNTVNWVESKSWNKKYGIVVMSDISKYNQPAAIPTMGAGSIALLIGPNAPIVFDQIRSSFFENVDDFFKPLKSKTIKINCYKSLADQYPVINSKLTIQSYLRAVFETYLLLNQKFKKKTGRFLDLANDFQFYAFHAPFAKMVNKGFAQLYLTDRIIHGAVDKSLQKQLSKSNFLLTDPKKMAEFANLSSQLFKKTTEIGKQYSQLVGNSYTCSLYFCLLSILSQQNLEGKRILMYSYGSGCAASIFSLKIKGDCSRISQQIRDTMAYLLGSRMQITPQELFRRKDAGEENYLKHDYKSKVISLSLIEQLLRHLSLTCETEHTTQNKWIRILKEFIKERQRVVLILEYPMKTTTALQPEYFSQEASSNSHQHMAIAQTLYLDYEMLSMLPQRSRKNTVNNIFGQGFIRSLSNKDLTKYVFSLTNYFQKFDKQFIVNSIQKIRKVYPFLNIANYEDGGLTAKTANLMIQNCIGMLRLPLGLGQLTVLDLILQQMAKNTPFRCLQKSLL